MNTVGSSEPENLLEECQKEHLGEEKKTWRNLLDPKNEFFNTLGPKGVIYDSGDEIEYYKYIRRCNSSGETLRLLKVQQFQFLVELMKETSEGT